MLSTLRSHVLELVHFLNHRRQILFLRNALDIGWHLDRFTISLILQLLLEFCQVLSVGIQGFILHFLLPIIIKAKLASLLRIASQFLAVLHLGVTLDLLFFLLFNRDILLMHLSSFLQLNAHLLSLFGVLSVETFY